MGEGDEAEDDLSDAGFHDPKEGYGSDNNESTVGPYTTQKFYRSALVCLVLLMGQRKDYRCGKSMDWCNQERHKQICASLEGPKDGEYTVRMHADEEVECVFVQ